MGRRVEHDGRKSLAIRFPFDRGLVDQIKTLPRRRWNADGKFWSVPTTDVVRLVELLQDQGFRFDEATRAAYEDAGGTDSLVPPDTAGSLKTSEDYSVSGLNQHVQHVIQSAFPVPVWVIGEISGFNKNNHRRHVSFQLVELDEDGRKVSEVSATLFETTRREVEQALAQAGDPFKLEDEITVRMAVRIELYVPWGSYRVIVEELDLGFTLGEAARRREEIIRRLTIEGLAERNPALHIPPHPLRVGLITSLGSDAYNDILRTLQESGYAWSITAHGARVQGRQTEPSVLNALDYFQTESDSFDVILICRGGGSRTDLAWFDSEHLGRAVASFPLPIIVGIGHEQDFSVLDAIARRAKTPTAAAGFLVQFVRESIERVERCGTKIMEGVTASLHDESRHDSERARRLVLASRNLLGAERSRLDHCTRNASVGARARISAAHEQLQRWTAMVPRAANLHLERQRLAIDSTLRSLAGTAGHQLSAASRELARTTGQLGPRARRAANRELDANNARERRLRLVDPRRVLERGYSILRSDGGRVVTRAADVSAGQRIEAELRQGRLLLTASDSARNSDGEETDR